MPRLSLELFGSVQITLDGQPLGVGSYAHVRALLIYLALTADRPQQRDALATMFWPEHAASAARTNLRQALTHLRTALGERNASVPFLLVTRDTLQFNSASDYFLDVESFYSLLAAANAHDHDDLAVCATCLQRLQQATALYRGDLLDQFWLDGSYDFEEWALLRRESLHRTAIDTLTRLANAHERRQEYADACRIALRLLELDAWREETHRQVMRLYLLQGDRSSALAQYERCRDILRAELSIEPSDETAALASAIRAQSASRPAALMPAASTAIPTYLQVTNPYKGLRAFAETDAADFFGREALVTHLLEQLSASPPQGRFLAVVGPSGSGKSSVVRAGLLPALRRYGLPGVARLQIATMIPGAYPLTELATALQRIAPDHAIAPQSLVMPDRRGILLAAEAILPPDSELVLVIDQCEELFTLAEDAAVRDALLDSLRVAALDAHSRVRVVITLRADFYDRPLLHRGFGELLRRHTVVVLPLTPDELLRAIISPAQQVGVSLSDELVAAVVQDVAMQPGTLPLLQYALTELFERRKGQQLSLAEYRASGGVAGALNMRAEMLYQNLDWASQQMAHQFFLRLVTPDEGVEDTRRRVLLDELGVATTPHHANPTDDTPALMPHAQEEVSRETETDLRNLLDLLNRHRLVTFDRDTHRGAPTVELAHEALLRDWGRLRAWIAQSRDELRVHRRLLMAAAEWNAAARDSSFLASGTRLAQFEALQDSAVIQLNDDERYYLQASLAERARQEQNEHERQEHELRQAQRGIARLRWLIGGLAVLLLAALILAKLAYEQWQDAQASALVAQGQALASAAMQAIAEGNLDEARALSLAAVEAAQPVPEAQAILAQAAYAPGTRRLFSGHGGAVLSVAFSPDGRSVLSGSSDNTLRIWDAASGAERQRLLGLQNNVWSVAWSPDGRFVAAAAPDKLIHLWDVATGQEIRRFAGHSDEVTDVSFSPDGRFLLSASKDMTLRLWDASSGSEIRRFVGHSDWVWDAAFSPDGQTVLSGSSDNTMRLWDANTGEEVRSFIGHDNRVQSVAFSADGRFVVSGSWDETARLWDAATGEQLHSFASHDGSVASVAISPDGQTILSASGNVIHVWDATSGEELHTFKEHRDEIFDLSFSPDGRSFVSASRDGTLRLWDLYNGAEIQTLRGHTGWIRSVAMSRDGRVALSGSWDWTLRLWDLATGQSIHVLQGHTDGVEGAALSPDGSLALSGGAKGDMRLWDTQTGSELRQFKGHTDYVWDVAFSPDGKLGLSGSQDKTIRLWQIDSGLELRQFIGHEAGVESVAFSPDGHQVLSGSADSTVRLWDVSTGKELKRLLGHNSTVNSVAFSPDGTLALSGSADGTARLWDIEGGIDLHRFPKQTGPVLFVAFSPDGSKALFATGLSTLSLWDVATGQELRRFDTGAAQVYSAAFGPDGRSILAGTTDTTVRLWRIDDLAQLVAFAKEQRYLPELNCAQRARYQLQPLCASTTVCTLNCE